MTTRTSQIAVLAALGVLLTGMLGCPTFSLEELLAGLEPNCPEPNCPEPNCPDTTDPNTGVTAKSTHEKIFTEIITDGFQGVAESCLICHSDSARDVVQTGHYTWSGTTDRIAGLEGQSHGKVDLINNFCIAIPSNEGRCTMCHPSYGWQDDTFDLTDPDNVDCLVCHDTTATYKKHPTANGGGGPASLVVDGVVTPVEASDLQEVAYNVGTPGRHNCGACHYYAGGGDNVKHGDLSSALNSPTHAMDVHMDADGLDFSCQRCHTADSHHGIAGMPLHSIDEGGASPDCTTCHGGSPHAAAGFVSSVLNFHAEKVACQTCHLPTFARAKPTKVEWYWADAGQDMDPIPTDEFGMPTYDKKKGSFVYAMNVKPAYLWYDGNWQRMVVGALDTYNEAGTTADPVVLAAPTATIDTPGAKIYPFKKMIGNQPADTTNQRFVVPHLFGTKGGENPYWAKYDWDLALADGAAYTGVEYSGDYGFVNTVMYLTVNHEIAPAASALQCEDCHGVAGFFEALGYEEDPFGGS